MGLNQKDIEILKAYALEGNRERYWSYLAQKEGADGYGLLALGVVRNDNLPGQVANGYAQLEALKQNDRNPDLPDRRMSERDWEAFGATLLEKDLERRQHWMSAGKPDLALNLPGRDVQLSHDKAFTDHGLSPDCWTPRILLEAMRKNVGDADAERVWKEMLDNGGRGFYRAGQTIGNAYQAMPKWDATVYVVKLGVYEHAMANEALSSKNPNIIGNKSAFHTYDEAEGKWYFKTAGALIAQEERDPARIAQLNDTRDVRLERQAKAANFHPDDPFRSGIETPKVVYSEPSVSDLERRMAAIQPGGENHELYTQISAHVAALDARLGRSFDSTSERFAASLTARAVEQGVDRADHLVLSNATSDVAAGKHVFVVQGALDDPAQRRASMSTDEAVKMPLEQSMQRLELANLERGLAQSQEQSAQQELENHRQSVRLS